MGLESRLPCIQLTCARARLFVTLAYRNFALKSSMYKRVRAECGLIIDSRYLTDVIQGLRAENLASTHIDKHPTWVGEGRAWGRSTL